MELNNIREVRKFYGVFHQGWPYWLYFCHLGEDRLKLMVFCFLDNMATLKVKAGQTTGPSLVPEI